MSGGLIGTILLLPKYLLNGLGSSVERDMAFVERIIGFVVVSSFVGPVKIVGREKLLPETSPCVFIANHASQIDLGLVYFLFRRFKWIAKKSVLYLPGVGTLMLMGGHVLIDRFKGRKPSSRKMYQTAAQSLKDGVPIFIFPQGTRRMAERLPFKDGAFNIAIAGEVPLIPISINIPPSAWNDLYPLSLLWKKKDPVILTVHDPVHVTKDSDKAELKEKTFDIIHAILPLRENENGKEKLT